MMDALWIQCRITGLEYPILNLRRPFKREPKLVETMLGAGCAIARHVFYPSGFHADPAHPGLKRESFCRHLASAANAARPRVDISNGPHRQGPP